MENLVRVDPGLFIWTILTFVVLAALLAKFAWGPLLKALEQRQATIEKTLKDAEAAKKELEKLHGESAAIISTARVQAEQILSKSRTDADTVREELKDKARKEADAILREAKRQIEVEKSQALVEIRSEVADLSITIASKLLERNISKQDNDKLVEDTLQQLRLDR